MSDNFDIENLNVIDRINLYMNKFSKTHKKIALFIINNYEKAVFLSSSKLAKQCGVSESSVVRFSNFIDYDGFTQMQKSLQDFLKEKMSISQRLTSISKGNSTEIEILYDVLEKSKSDISWLMDNINHESFLKVIELLSTAKNVYLIGSRSSHSVTSFLGYGLSWIRDNVYVVDGIGCNFDKLANICEEDVLLSVSLPKYLKSTIKFHEYGAKKNAKTICITDTISSPLVKHSTIPILINNSILSFSDNLIPVMCIATGILNAVASVTKSSETIIKHYEEFWSELDLYNTDIKKIQI